MPIVARWNDAEIARSDDTVTLEGNHYFPRIDVAAELLTPSATTTVCPWKGTAQYYSIQVNGAVNPDAAWYYPDPKPAAEEIRDRLAFWRGVEVTEE
jgi:uncharacterized protein (DUF427 family)